MKVHTKFIHAFGALLIAALLFAVLPAGEVKAQTTITVCPTGGGCDYTSIQLAHDNAIAGDIIVVKDGTYDITTEPVAEKGLVNIYKQITIKAEEDGNGIRPVINASGRDGVFKIHANSLTSGEIVIEGFELTGDVSTGTAITAMYCGDPTPPAVKILDNEIHGVNAGFNTWGSENFCPVGTEYVIKGIEIKNNVFSNLGTGGADVFGIAFEGLSDSATSGGTFAAIVEGNTFSTIDDGTAQLGVGVAIIASGTNQAANAKILDNSFSNVAVGLGVPAGDISEIEVQYNQFDSSIIGLYNMGTGTANSSPNWWGAATGPVPATQLIGDVDYNPWCADDACLSLAFLVETSDSIQAAVDAIAALPTPSALTTYTIYVAEGTYNEIVGIIQEENKNIVLQPEMIGGVYGNVTLTGQIRIDGNGRSAGTESVAIQGFTFDLTATGNQDAITAYDLTPTNYVYSHNIYVKDSTFIGDLATGSDVGVRAGSTGGHYNYVFENITTTSLHSLGQMTSVSLVTVRNSTVSGGKSGVNLSGSPALVDNLTYNGNSYGIRTDSDLTIKNSSLTSSGNSDYGTPVFEDPDTALVLRHDTVKTITIENSLLQNSNVGDFAISNTTDSPPEKVTLVITDVDTGDESFDYTMLGGFTNVLLIHPDGDTETITFYTTIQAAIDAAAAGDTVMLLPGTYEENATINKQVSLVGADPENPPVIKGTLTVDHSGATMIEGINFITFDDTTTTTFYNIYLKQGNSIKITDCSFDAGGSFLARRDVAIQMSSTATNITIDGCEFKNGYYVALQGNMQYVTIRNTTIENGKSGINAQYANNLLVEKSNISVVAQGVDNDTYGIRFGSASGTANNLHVNDVNFSVDANGLTPESGTYHSAVIIRPAASGILTVTKGVILGEVVNLSSTQLNATFDYWGSPCGPSNIVGDVDYTLWYVDEAMTTETSVLPVSGTYTFPTTMSTLEKNAIIACAAEGTVFTFATGDHDGGISVKNDYLTFELNGATIGAGGPAFLIQGDNIIINGPGLLDGGGSSYNAIVVEDVEDGVFNFTLDTVEITGWETGVYYFGTITNTQVVDNFIHDNTGHGVYFEEQPIFQTPVSFYIQGNMFKHNNYKGVYNRRSPDINTEYNSWSDFAGADGPDGDGANNADTDPYTHVDLYMVSTRWEDVDNWPNQVFVDDADPLTPYDTITYQVKAHVENVTGASFVLEFDPALIEVKEIVNNDYFPWPFNDLEYTGTVLDENITYNNTEGWIAFDGASLTEVDGDIVLFEVTFTGKAPGVVTLNFDEATDEFAMSPDYGPSNNIYADELVDATLDVITRPTLEITGLDTPFVAGVMSHEIINTICNADTGGLWDDSPTAPDAIGWIRISDITEDEIASLQFMYDGIWYPFEVQDGDVIQQVGNDVIARFGNYDYGFDIQLDWCDVDAFRVTFTTPGTHNVTVEIYDMMDTSFDGIDPEDILLAYYGPEEITILGGFDVIGTIAMQGRTLRDGVPLTLTDVDGAPVYGPFTDFSGPELAYNVLFEGVNGSLYEITTLQERYLNVHESLDKQIYVLGAYTIPALELKGGNAYWLISAGEYDNEIDSSDASIVGSEYGGTPGAEGGNSGDVNFDGKVNIQDLALVGGNYTLTSTAAYDDWLSPSEWDGNYPTTAPTSLRDPLDGVQEIYTAEEFAWILSQPDMFPTGVDTVRLMNDIDLANFSWTPSKGLASGSATTGDTFDGNGHTIYNLTAGQVLLGADNFSGLFVGANGSAPIVQNLAINGAQVEATGEHSFAAVVVAANDFGGDFINVTVKNATVKATKYAAVISAYSSSYDGGAYFTGCTVESSTLEVQEMPEGAGVDEPHVGGIVGLMNVGTFVNNKVENLTITVTPATGFSEVQSERIGALIGTAQAGVYPKVLTTGDRLGELNIISSITYNGSAFTDLIGLDNR